MRWIKRILHFPLTISAIVILNVFAVKLLRQNFLKKISMNTYTDSHKQRENELSAGFFYEIHTHSKCLCWCQRIWFLISQRKHFLTEKKTFTLTEKHLFAQTKRNIQKKTSNQSWSLSSPSYFEMHIKNSILSNHSVCLKIYLQVKQKTSDWWSHTPTWKIEWVSEGKPQK